MLQQLMVYPSDEDVAATLVAVHDAGPERAAEFELLEYVYFYEK